MKKKILLLATSAFMSVGVLTMVFLDKQETISLKAKDELYKLVMNSSKNKFHNNTDSTLYSGESVVQTNLGSDITFSYSYLSGGDSVWHSFKNGSYFYNVTPIHGLESISLTFNNSNNRDFKLYWANTTSFDEGKYQTFAASTSSTLFYFNGDYPTYFKFESQSSLSISEIELGFSCRTNYPSEEEKEWDKAHGVVPTFYHNGKTIYYGLYPQNNVNDSTLVTALNGVASPESNGWYLYNGVYYAKVVATPFDSNRYFDNGTKIVSGATYWFECEPIVWRTLANNNGSYYILSRHILDAQGYFNSDSDRTIDGQTIYANNYKYSDVREWLNDDFYNSAFALGNSYIQTTTVDNSASTTNNSNNSYACDNTEDKIFLPSYQDYINSSYGFATYPYETETRYCEATDWARARGVWYKSVGDYPYSGYYWTRSPSNVDSSGAWTLSFNGTLDYEDVYDDEDFGVRPAITLSMN